MMLLRGIGIAALCAAAMCGQKVKTKLYIHPKSCFRTYHLETGRILTSRGLLEDPTVNSIMKEAVSAEMIKLKIDDADKGAELKIRFMGGNSAGLQVDDSAIGDVAMWDIGGPQEVLGRTYKKSALVIAVVDSKSNDIVWAAKCVDKFGDPNRMKERIQKAVIKAFAAFPKKLGCS